MTKKQLIDRITGFPPENDASGSKELISKDDTGIHWDMDKLKDAGKERLERLAGNLAVVFKNFGTLDVRGDEHIIKDKIWIDQESGSLIELFALEDEVIIRVTDDPKSEDRQTYTLELAKREFAILHGMMFAMMKRQELQGIAAILEMQNIELKAAY